MGLLSKLGTIAGTAIGGPIGGMIGGALGSAAGGVLAGGAAKKQTKNALNDLNAAQAQGMTALSGARDAGIGYLSPYNQLGATGTAGVQNMLTPGFQYQPTDPSYQFRFNEGQRAVDRSAAAGGSLYSGGTLRALNRYGQGVANSAYQQDFDNRLGVSQLGLNAANSMANVQTSYGSNTANLLSNMARARVPVYGARGEAIAGQYGSLFGALDGVSGAFGGMGGSATGGGGGQTLADAWGFMPQPSGDIGPFVNTPGSLNAAFGF